MKYKIKVINVSDKNHALHAWSALIVLISDYWTLNGKTIKDAYPIPRIGDNLDAFYGSQWFLSQDFDVSNYEKNETKFHRNDCLFNPKRWTLSV